MYEAYTRHESTDRPVERGGECRRHVEEKVLSSRWELAQQDTCNCYQFVRVD